MTDVPPGEYPPGKPAPGELRPQEVQQPGGRLSRLWKAADRRNVPLRTIVTAVGVVAVTYLAGKLLYRIRDIVLVVLVAGFIAVLLNPLVVLLQRHVFPRRGAAVAIVTLLALLAFIGLAVAFGYPLVNGITHLADALPSYVAKRGARPGLDRPSSQQVPHPELGAAERAQAGELRPGPQQAGPEHRGGRPVPGDRDIHDIHPGPAAPARGAEDAVWPSSAR